VSWQDAPAFTDRAYRAAPRSVVVLWAPLAAGDATAGGSAA
jgi:hypothetical protein